jgi:hypothetical protein
LLDLAGRVAATRCRWLQLLAEFNRSKHWKRLGFGSCTQWLRARMGLSRRAADEQLRVARALSHLPLLSESFSAGAISYAKVRAITRVATVADESAWLELAATRTAGQLEVAARVHKGGDDDDPPTASPSELHWHWDAHGNLRIRGTLSAEHGALMIAALEEAMTSTDANETSPPVGANASAAARRASALLTLLQRVHRPTRPRLRRNNRGPGARPRLDPQLSVRGAWPQRPTRLSHRATEGLGPRPRPSNQPTMPTRSVETNPAAPYVPGPRSAPSGADRGDPGTIN